MALMDAELKLGQTYVRQHKGLNINQHLPIAQQPVVLLDSAVVACILPLLSSWLPMMSLVELSSVWVYSAGTLTGRALEIFFTGSDMKREESG